MLPFEFNYKQPDYDDIFLHRSRMLLNIRANPHIIPFLHTFYKDNPAQFITDWGLTFDPRNADVGLPTYIPFVLFDKQIEWVDWLLERWHSREPGLVEKSRDIGMSWLSIALSCTLCLFNEGIAIGFGSRKEEYVDKIGSPKCLFWKAREFLKVIPQEFLGGWDLKKHAPHMRILFPGTNSTMTGESGDGIGRGDRTSIYFVDEAAYIERPALIEASLSNTTNCRIDISSAHGMNNPFAQKRFSGKFNVFTFFWRDDPRKDADWYARMQNDLDPVTLAQEVDINYSASVEGVVIPPEWVAAAVDACSKLNIDATGATIAALDVADQGIDLNAICIRKGVQLIRMESWSGKNSDDLIAAERSVTICDETECDFMLYDADGLGAFIRSSFRIINERRKSQSTKEVTVQAFRGSGEVLNPEREMIKGRKNKDYFMNRKAQAWWALRQKFRNTFRAANGEPYDKEEFVSINSSIKNVSKLIMELSQPTYTISTTGKIVINKTPDGTRSPNLADAFMMVYSPAKRHAGLFT